MTRFFVPLDVNYQLDDKIMSAGHVAECLYVRALAYSKRAGTEGRIKQAQLRALALGLPGQPLKHATGLVDVGLWEAIGADWYITGWLNHNLSNAALAEQKAKIRAKSIAGNHKRHHVAKGVTDDDCELCNPPYGDSSSSQQGQKSLATEEEDEQKTNRTEDEHEHEEKSSSSPRDSHAVTDRQDDDDFHKTIRILVEAKARDHPPTNRKAWEMTTIPTTITEDGDTIRAQLAAGNTPVQAAGYVLKSQRKAELAAGKLA